jgi:hypothetical protein
VSDDISFVSTWQFAGDIDELLFLLRSARPYWKFLPFEPTVEYVLGGIIGYEQDCIGTVGNILELILGEKELDERVILATGDTGVNLLRMSALDLVFSLRRATAPSGQISRIISSKLGKSNFEAGGSFFCSRISAQMELVLRLITSGSDIHNEILPPDLLRESSILIAIILKTFDEFCNSCSCCIVSTLPLVARVWLEILYEADVDLIKYGQRELSLLSTRYLHLSSIIDWRILSFTYGPTPEDWEFRLVHDNWYREYNRYQAVQEFWNIVENPERNIPGAWDADFDDAGFDVLKPWMFGFERYKDDYCRFRSP